MAKIFDTEFLVHHYNLGKGREFKPHGIKAHAAELINRGVRIL